jgi:hypothetical protein
MYDLQCDPLEMTNLAHASHRTPASNRERVRLHQRLTDVMDANGTTPDEIRWPSADEFRPATQLSVGGEQEAATALA